MPIGGVYLQEPLHTRVYVPEHINMYGAKVNGYSMIGCIGPELMDALRLDVWDQS